MHLVVKKGEQIINEFSSDTESVHIGRTSSNQIRLPDASVSKQHAVVFAVDGKWMVEDLDSANKTYLNDKAIHKAEIKTGDIVRITDFTIEINPGDKTETADEESDIEELEIEISEDEKPKAGKTTAGRTAAGRTGSSIYSATAARDMQVVVRKPGAEQSPPITLAPERAVDFLEATKALGEADNLDNTLLILLETVAKQLNTNEIWCALREQPGGPMTSHAGKRRDGEMVELNDLQLNDKITQAIETGEFLLFIFSRDLDQDKNKQVRSTMIAPIMDIAGCFGAIYVNNTFRDNHYSLKELDYLMLLAIHTAAILEKL